MLKSPVKDGESRKFRRRSMAHDASFLFFLTACWLQEKRRKTLIAGGTIGNFIRREKHEARISVNAVFLIFFSQVIFAYVMANKRFICRLTWQSLQSRYTSDLEVSRQVRSLLPADIAGRSSFTLTLNFLRLVSSFAFQSRQSARVVHRVRWEVHLRDDFS
jgi:hypothetical protein